MSKEILKEELLKALGDKRHDKQFMQQLDYELSRFKSLGDDASVVEATLLGYIIGSAKLTQLLGALEQSDMILLHRPGNTKSSPLCIDCEDGNGFVALFTSIDKAIEATEHDKNYSRPGQLSMRDALEILIVDLQIPNLGLWVNPYDELMTFKFTPKQAKEFARIVLEKPPPLPS
ncbi:MAG: hypothetical protein AAGH72_11645 [Verrucomicrobiota bacterium]